MTEGFEIVDGRLFIDKELFRLAQLTDNNLRKLTQKSKKPIITRFEAKLKFL